jgi:biopolymer transport protein ExbD/biopolymer transport protein TolR
LRRRRAGRLHLNAEINVVSLIDVMMLLLVIFMITAPLMQGGVDVKLPEASAKPLEDKGSLVVTVDRNGQIHVDRDALSYGEFRSSFKALLQARRSKGVTLRGDRGASWERVSQVMAVIRDAGVVEMGIVLEQEPTSR